MLISSLTCQVFSLVAALSAPLPEGEGGVVDGASAGHEPGVVLDAASPVSTSGVDEAGPLEASPSPSAAEVEVEVEVESDAETELESVAVEPPPRSQAEAESSSAPESDQAPKTEPGARAEPSASQHDRRAGERRTFNTQERSIFRNRWPLAPLCNLGEGSSLCLTIDAEVFTGYRLRSIAGERFGEFALDRSELGTNLWYRPNTWIDGGVTLRLEAIRSAGPQSLIGIDGDSLVIRLAQAYGHTAAHLGPISIGVRGGMIPERWLEQLEKGYDTVGVGRLGSEQNLLMERADLGASITASGWDGLVELDVQFTNGEGRAQEELNRGKNTTAIFTLRPLRMQHARGPITLSLHGAYRDGSWGIASARAHRAAGAVTFASPWAFAGAELVQAFGVREQGDRVSRSLGGWVSAYAWQPYIGLVAKYDHVRQDLDLSGSTVDIVTAGVFSDLFGYAWRRRRRVRLYVAYQHEGYGVGAGPVPGAPQAADSHRFLLQIEAAGLVRAL